MRSTSCQVSSRNSREKGVFDVFFFQMGNEDCFQRRQGIRRKKVEGTVMENYFPLVFRNTVDENCCDNYDKIMTVLIIII